MALPYLKFNEIMDYSNKNKSTGWAGIIKTIASALSGAVISCAATLGFMDKSEAELAQEKVDNWLDKAEYVYVNIHEAHEDIYDIVDAFKEGRFTDILPELYELRDHAHAAIDTIKDWKSDMKNVEESINESESSEE